MSRGSRGLNTLRASVRGVLRRALSQERRTELKRLQGVAKKRLAPVRSMIHGSFGNEELRAELLGRLPEDFEVLMVHGSYDELLPMYKGTASELLAVLISICGPERTLVMPSFVMGGRTFDTREYYSTRPFDVRRTPGEVGLLGEVFRRTPNVLRSLHPTCSVCALGPLAKEMTAGHHVSVTGFTPDSPFGAMNRHRTAILGLGVEYFRVLTHAHTAGHQMGDAFPIKFNTAWTNVTLVDYDGSRYDYKLGLPDRSKKLDLTVLWMLLSKDELREWRFHGVPMFVITEARIVTEKLLEAAQRGITIYGKAPAADSHHAAAMSQAEPTR